MQLANTDEDRGARLVKAMKASGRGKIMALAAELGVSPAAISKWRQGSSMSVEHACQLAEVLDVSLDWLLMGRETGLQDPYDRALVSLLHERPDHIRKLVTELVAAIPVSKSG